MKKLLCLLLSALMLVGACVLPAFAADENVAYIAFNGSNANDGRSDATPKKSLGAPDGEGVISLLTEGGTLVVSQKLYFGSDYTWDLFGGVTITGNYGGKDYKNPEPASNPASGCMKFASGKILTVKSDLTLDDLILFQEGGQNTFIVEDGATLTITDKIVCMSAQEYYMNIEVMAGGKAIVNGGTFSKIEGDGDIQIASGVTVLEGAPKPAESKFNPTRTYENQFTDVTADKWFHSYVKTAYEYALANGTSATKFSPDGTFTVAQALTAAANIHTAYTGKTVDTANAKNWYDPYVNYCIANGIIKDGQFADYNKNITRGEMAIVFANILPDSEYAAIRTYTLSDMNDTLPSAAAVKKLAEAGIVGGSNGKYNPNDDIKRSEACVIFTRIAVASMRDAKAN